MPMKENILIVRLNIEMMVMPTDTNWKTTEQHKIQTLEMKLLIMELQIILMIQVLQEI